MSQTILTAVRKNQPIVLNVANSVTPNWWPMLSPISALPQLCSKIRWMQLI